MKGTLALFSLSLCVFLVGAMEPRQTGKSVAPPAYVSDVKPILARFCLPCHSGDGASSGLDLKQFSDGASVLKSKALWLKVAMYVEDKHMPPAGQPQPTDAQRSLISGWIHQALGDSAGAEPGHVTMRRLNKAEYANTVRDLLGVDFKGTSDFPSDDVGYGFDNIGDVLSISPLLMEKYLNAAEQVAEMAVVEREGKTAEYDAGTIQFGAASGAIRAEGLTLFSNGPAWVNHKFPKGGHYVLRVRAFGDQAGPEPCNMRVQLDGQVLTNLAVPGRGRVQAANYDVPLTVKSGLHRVEVAFTNDYYQPTAPDPKDRDRNLIVEMMTIQGPLVTDVLLPDSHLRLIPKRPAPGQELEAARETFRGFASRAFRRPATDVEVDKLASYLPLALKNGDTYERGIQLGIEAALVSPSFLFRVEDSPGRALSGYELASRLSYFLWSSMPDAKLFALAEDGSLQKPEVLAQQARRMLKDPKVQALSDNFAAQWLTLRKLGTAAPDRERFPSFDDDMRKDMERETLQFFGSIVQNDGSVIDFLDGRYSYVNERLAKLYGISGVTGNQFRRVSLEGLPRAGVLTQASVLTVTSNPTRTSPVKRGKWVLEEFLGTPPPPPPPGVGVLKGDGNDDHLATLRQQMESHRKNPACASCHARMDPLGFGLENFDAVGKWRTQDGTFAIDASGQLPDGRKFDGPTGLIQILLGQKDAFVHCLGEKLTIYALGRGINSSDNAFLNQLVKTASGSGYKFSSLVESIVKSDAFRMRNASAGAKG